MPCECSSCASHMYQWVYSINKQIMVQNQTWGRAIWSKNSRQLTFSCTDQFPAVFWEYCQLQMVPEQHMKHVSINSYRNLNLWTYFPDLWYCHTSSKVVPYESHKNIFAKCTTVKAPVFGTLNSAISNFHTRFVRTVMEVLKYCWMYM